MNKAAFFTHNLDLGGAQRVIVNLTSELAERSHEVEIVLQRKQGELLKQVHDDVTIFNLDADPFIPMVLALRAYLREHRPGVLLSTVNTANLAAILAVKTTRSRTRHVVRIANTPSMIAKGYDKRFTDKPFPYLMQWLYPRADRIVAVSGGLADELLENYGVNRERIDVIYNPTVTDSLIAQSKEPVDHQWFQHPETEVVLGVGSLTEQKDFSTLLRAFSLVREERDAKLVILGDGEQRGQIGRLARELGIEDDVSLPGTVTNPYPYMANADVFVLSSLYEGCPNVLIEAMACACPVVATDCPHGPNDILEGGRIGQLVPVGDVGRLKEAILETMADPPPTDQLTNRARSFHVKSVADRYEKVLYGEE